tara:strand:+ start:254 stop:1066 length:813 start_codon:yes stop_codon:yes gene_type:complete
MSNTEYLINSSHSMLYFFFITSLYFIVKFFIETKSIATSKGETDEDKSIRNRNKIIYTLIYFLLVIVGEFFISVAITKSSCGYPQFYTAFIITLIPWVIIFLLLTSLLMVFPGWLKPFSNTFGYAVTLVAGINSTMNKILKPNVQNSADTPENKALQESLALIYQNRTLMINEITRDNFNDFWLTMKALIKTGEDTEKNKKSLFKMIVLKDNIAEYIWYVLTGLLVCSIGYNYLVSATCKKPINLEEQNAKRNKILDKMKNVKYKAINLN